MKRKTWLISGAAGLALALAVAWAFAPRPVAVEMAPVTQGRFETTIDEDGKTRLADRYVVSAPLAGRLARITLKEGDVVAADAPLAVLRAVLPVMLDERTRRELQARVAGAQDNVSRAGSRSARAQVSLDQANNEVRRSEQLARQGFIAPIKVETDRLATLGAQREVEAAAAERRMAAHELEQTQAALSVVRQPVARAIAEPNAAVNANGHPNGNAPVNGRADGRADGRKDAGQKTAAGADNSGGGFTVRAPSAGRVLRVLQASEGAVALGTPLLEIGDTRRMEVVAELLTTDALAAATGSRVVIERWGGPTSLDGRVRSVEPAAFTKVSALGVEEQRVRVLVDITSPQAAWQALGDGYRVSVRIVTLSEAQAVQVPVSAVFPLPAGAGAAGVADAARYAVFVADDGHARQVPVVLGARNGSQAWIRSGVTPGQQVIVYPQATVRDGVRVAARKP